jgi:hypothetical protein
VTGQATHGGVVGAREVSDTRALHLDDPGTEVGQLSAGKWRSNGLFDRHHRDALEGKGGIHVMHNSKCKNQNAKCKSQKAEGRRQKAEGRRQNAT